MSFNYKAWLDSMHRRLKERGDTEGYRMVESFSAPPADKHEFQGYVTRNKLQFCSELSAFYCEASSNVRVRWECSAVGPMDTGKKISIGFQLSNFKSIKRFTTNAARLLFGFALKDKSGTVSAVLRQGYLISQWDNQFLFIVAKNENIASGIYFWTSNRGMTRCANSLVDWLKFIASVDYLPPILETIERSHDGELRWF